MRVPVLILILLCLTGPVFGVENKEVLDALIDHHSVKIPKKKLHCEIESDNNVTVGDFFVRYITWAQAASKAPAQSLSCKGKKVLDCVWQFGETENADNPGWSISLTFKYNEKTRKVAAGSIGCDQVP